MKFCIMGMGMGMGGHIVSLYLSSHEHDVTAISRDSLKIFNIINNKNIINAVKLDVNNELERLSEIIYRENFDAVINCAGILNQAAEDNHAEAVYINSFLPHFLAKITQNIKTKIVHLSTDCVFSGKKGNYKDDDFIDGISFYARSKALGELNDNKNITLRTSIIGPDMNFNGIGLLNWFMKQESSVKGFVKAIWTGQTTLQLAKTIEFVVKNNVTGLINAVPDTSINKYELLKLFNKYIRKNKIKIEKDENFASDKSLVRSDYNKFNYKIPDYEAMISELADWMKEHREFYPHYEL